MVMKETRAGERERWRSAQMNMPTARTWAVVNPSAQNALGSPHRATSSCRASTRFRMSRPTSQVRKRAGFINNHFWATRFNDDRAVCRGRVSQSEPRRRRACRRGSPTTNRSSNQDVVVWYTFGITHIPRPEEWPIMSVDARRLQDDPRRILRAQSGARRTEVIGAPASSFQLPAAGYFFFFGAKCSCICFRMSL